jgi:surface antigen
MDVPDYSGYFSTGDIIQIGYDVFVIVNGQRRLVPNPDTLDALGIPRSWIDNKGFSDSQLSTISRGADIPDVNRDYSGLIAFKNVYFPNTTPFTATPSSVELGGVEEGGSPTGSLPEDWDVVPDPPPSLIDRIKGWVESVLDLLAGEAKAYSEWKPRADIPDSTECVGFVANKKCRGALYWLDYDAYAYKWVEMASSDKARELGVTIHPSPEAGDIAVWDRNGCDEANADWGHVAYVSSKNPDGTFNVIESNWGGDHREGRRANIGVLPCISFIRNGCNVTSPAETPAATTPTYPWWVPDFAKQFYDDHLRR